TELVIDDVNWFIPTPIDEFIASCKIRYRHRETPARIIPLDDGQVRIIFDQPQTGVTPGQAAVIYQADRVLGGGWIQ
ncbi:MAG TPA: aminomethyltransferase beta-barrel domain-containing protein, partial [Geothermobacteraceae bacterium]|nr:aminomethyltransferase beta-barrel domain-containing protein [Geothermobacteraceae bacterium]